MISIELYSGGTGKLVDFPENWNEITTSQLEAIAPIFEGQYKTLNEQKCAVLVKMLQLVTNDTIIPLKISIDDLLIYGLPIVEFMFKSNNRTKQPYPELEINGKKYYGPTDGFDNMQVGEYEEAYALFSRFKRDNDASCLIKLAALLYRPDRIPFLRVNPSTHENLQFDYKITLTDFEKLKPEVITTIMIWFNGCQNVMQNIFDDVYDGTGGSEVDVMGFTKAIHSAAGPKNGTRDQVRRLPIKELLFDMNEESKKAKELNEQYDKLRKVH